VIEIIAQALDVDSYGLVERDGAHAQPTGVGEIEVDWLAGQAWLALFAVLEPKVTWRTTNVATEQRTQQPTRGEGAIGVPLKPKTGNALAFVLGQDARECVEFDGVPIELEPPHVDFARDKQRVDRPDRV
jgi:hypothetical protein